MLVKSGPCKSYCHKKLCHEITNKYKGISTNKKDSHLKALSVRDIVDDDVPVHTIVPSGHNAVLVLPGSVHHLQNNMIFTL